MDGAGNVFLVSQSYNVVFRRDGVTGILTVVAGNGAPGFSGDNGPATSAQLNRPNGVAVDSAGNLYIADTYNDRVRKVSNGLITTVAGTGVRGFSGDNGPATSVELGLPSGVAVDSAGNLFITDSYNNLVRKVSNGVITTVAGNGTGGYSGDNGPATSAELEYPFGVGVDSAGNIYIADFFNNIIREVSNGVITTLAGNGTQGFSGDNGPATSAQLNRPYEVAADSAGNIYIVDTGNSRVRKVSNGAITTVAGNGFVGYGGDNGPATSAELFYPQGIAVDSAGNIYIADTNNYRVRKVSSGEIVTVMGNGTYGFNGDNGPATSAQLGSPSGVVADSAGSLYIADTFNNRIRKVSNGAITTVAGNGNTGRGGDNGPATSAQLYRPYGVATDSAGNVYIADTINNLIRKVSNGVITTVAGTGAYGSSGDNGPATSAQLFYPYGVAVDSSGDLYIADTANYRVRKVSSGVITTVAGNGTYGFSGDNGPAVSAELSAPFGIAVDSAGSFYIADDNNRVRRVSNGVITTVAGNGTYGFGGDNGPATGAELADPAGVAVDSAGNIYIVDTYNNRIRRVSNGVITTVAGNGTLGSSGDNGPATGAELALPSGAAVDSAGNVYVGDTYNNRIRILQPVPLTVTAGSPLNAGEVNVAYSETLLAGGGTPPYLWSMTVGAQLPGLSLSAAGVLGGTPTTAGTYNFTVMVTDSLGAMASASLQVVINPALGITTTSPLPDGEVNSGYAQTIAASGGASPYNWAINAGTAAPPGLSLSSAGVLSGSPGASGTYTFSVTVTDSLNAGSSASFQVAIAPALAINTTSLLPFQVNAPYSLTLGASGGWPPYTWSVTGLPSTISLGSGGQLTGTPTVTGSYNLTECVTDSLGVSVCLPPFPVSSTWAYLVGDVYPYSSDYAPNFGEWNPRTGFPGVAPAQALTIQDVVAILFAANNISTPEYAMPVAGSDRFDAMDTFPKDTSGGPGGDGCIDNRDVVVELFRFNNLDLSRPIRSSPPVPKTCPNNSRTSPQDRSDVTTPPDGTLIFGDVAMSGSDEERMPVYLNAVHGLSRVTLTFGLGDQQSPLRFVAAKEHPPSLAHDKSLGVVAVVWAEGLSVPAGERLLLGYIEGPVGALTNVRMYGWSASGLDDFREVVIDVPQAVGRRTR